MFMMDECVGHMTEKVVIPDADKLEISPRRRTPAKPGDYKPFATNGDLVPYMAHAGEGYKFHTTGLTHDERGYPAMNTQAQDKLIRRLRAKIRTSMDRISLLDEEHTEDADVIVVSYGITSRVAQRAIDLAREKGVKAGRLRLLTVWPFPEERIRTLAEKTKAFVVPELNLGQVALEVERVAASQGARTIPVTHAGGSVHRPEQIVDAIMEAVR
jgi:2-oxoglutarate ferredoxin oxidoreductase subunit alpha